jgi:hypothetical protein
MMFVTACTEAFGEGVIHDISVPRDIVSITLTIDEEFDGVRKSGTGIGKFLRGSDVSHGSLMRVLCKRVKKKADITGEELQLNVRKILKSHSRQFVIESSTSGLFSCPLF